MTINVQSIALTNTIDFMRNRINELSSAMSTYVITTDSNTATGNAAITGTFTSNNLISNTITVNTGIYNTNILVGNSTVNTTITSTSVNISNSTANISLTIPSNTQIANGQYYYNANGSWSLITSQYIPLSNNSINTTGTSTQVIDSYQMNSYSTAEYLINVKDNVANNYYTSKILTSHNTANAFSTEYATITTNTYMGVFTSSTNTSHVLLNFTPVSSNTTVKFIRTIL